jgi:uncharacterized ferritin-like protein (DUF455 family)
MIGRTRMGPWGVETAAERLANIQAALRCSVNCLGAWIAGVPELETKITWSYHLYEHAHAADQIGKRIFTLIAERPHVPSPANRSLFLLLREVAALRTPTAQIAGLYYVLLPAVLDACRAHVEQTNPVADEPTLRVLHPIAEAIENQLIWGARQGADESEVKRLSLYLAEAGGLHGPGLPYEGPDTIQPVLVNLPARDQRFARLEPGKRMPKAKPLQTAEGRIRLLHIALINLEIPAIEVCGRMIAAFPDAPWELKMDLAHQIWDEARHAQMCADRLVELGGAIGQFPYHHKVWEHSIGGKTLAEQFATTQRIHEGNGLDQTLLARDLLAEIGDKASSQIMDYIMADEVLHVRSGNRWINHFLPNEADREALYRQIEERLGPAAVGGPPLNRSGRRKAGFTEVELDWLTTVRDRRAPRHPASVDRTQRGSGSDE